MARLARSISHLDVHLAPWSSEALLATADRPDQLGRESCVIAKSFANSQSSNGRRMMDVERLTSPKDRSYSLYETAIASTPLYRLYFCGHKSSYAPPCGCAGSGWGKDLYFFYIYLFSLSRPGQTHAACPSAPALTQSHWLATVRDNRISFDFPSSWRAPLVNSVFTTQQASKA